MPLNPNDALPGYRAVEHIGCDGCAFIYGTAECRKSPPCSRLARADGHTVIYRPRPFLRIFIAVSFPPRSYVCVMTDYDEESALKQLADNPGLPPERWALHTPGTLEPNTWILKLPEVTP